MYTHIYTQISWMKYNHSSAIRCLFPSVRGYFFSSARRLQLQFHLHHHHHHHLVRLLSLFRFCICVFCSLSLSVAFFFFSWFAVFLVQCSNLIFNVFGECSAAKRNNKLLTFDYSIPWWMLPREIQRWDFSLSHSLSVGMSNNPYACRIRFSSAQLTQYSDG